MTEIKRLKTALKVLAILFVVSILIMIFLTEAVASLLIYSGFGTLLCFIAVMDLDAGKEPDWVLIGVLLAFFGFAFMGSLDHAEQWLDVVISAICGTIGLRVVAKGIKIKHGITEKTTQRPLRLRIGLGLLLAGNVVSVSLAFVNTVFLAVGAYLIAIGMLVSLVGLRKKQKAADNRQKTVMVLQDSKTTTDVMPCCPRCGKILQSGAIRSFDGVKYCQTCQRAIKQQLKDQQIQCSVCGVELSMEDMHIMDDKMLCRSCFQKKIAEFESHGIDG